MRVLTVVGADVSTVKVAELDAETPGFRTVTAAVVGELTSPTKIVAVRIVGETNVVTRPLPFHCTVAPGTKLAPYTVSVKAPLFATTFVGYIEFNVATELPVGVAMVSRMRWLLQSAMYRLPLGPTTACVA